MSKKREARSKYVDYGAKTDKYEWDQWEDELLVTVKMPPGIRAKEVLCEIKTGHLKVGLKGKPPIFDGDLFSKVLPDESTWTLDNGTLEITMQKSTGGDTWWPCVLKGDPEIDVKAIEGSKYLDDSLLKQIKEKKDLEKKEKEEKEKAEKEGNGKQEENKDEKKEEKPSS